MDPEEDHNTWRCGISLSASFLQEQTVSNWGVVGNARMMWYECIPHRERKSESSFGKMMDELLAGTWCHSDVVAVFVRK